MVVLMFDPFDPLQPLGGRLGSDHHEYADAALIVIGEDSRKIAHIELFFPEFRLDLNQFSHARVGVADGGDEQHDDHAENAEELDSDRQVEK